MKLRKISPRFQNETYEQQLAAKRYNPAAGFWWRRAWVTLSSGTSDTVRIWAAGNRLYALSINYRHGYAGLEEFEQSSRGDPWETVSSVFMQGEGCPADLLDKSDVEIRNHLMEHL